MQLHTQFQDPKGHGDRIPVVEHRDLLPKHPTEPEKDVHQHQPWTTDVGCKTLVFQSLCACTSGSRKGTDHPDLAHGEVLLGLQELQLLVVERPLLRCPFLFCQAC